MNKAKRKLSLVLAALPLLLLGCNNASKGGAAASSSGAPAAGAKVVKLAFVTNNPSQFWKIAEAGLRKYEKEAKVQVANLTADSLPFLMARAEAYPEIKASEHFMRLQHTLADIEAHIAAARRFYNSAVNEYNNAIQMFPTNLIAGSPIISS